MKVRILIANLLLITAVLLTAESEQVLTVQEDQAVALAMENNVSLRSASLDLESARAGLDNRWNLILPDFSASTGISRSDSLLTRSGSGSSGWSVNGSLSAQLTLSASTAISAAGTALAYQAESLSYDAAREELIVSVKKQFYYLLVNKENMDLQERNLDLAEKRYLQAKTNFENGLASEMTLMEARNSYESLKPDLLDTKTSYETQLMSFKKLLGLDLDNPIDIDGSLDVQPLDLDGELLIDTYLMNRLDVQAVMKALENAENQLSLTTAGNLSPSVKLSTGWTSSAQDISKPDWSDSLTVSAAVTLPLNGFIPGSSESLAIKDAARSAEQARLSVEDTILSAEQEIRTILMELEGYRQNIEITGLSVELAQKTYDMTEAAYQSGSRELLDVEDAQNNLLEAEQNLLLSRYNYLSGLLDLEYALNADLEEIITLGE